MPKKILIIEDDKFLRELMVRKLSVLKYEVISAVDGEEGLEKIKTELPDVVLLDLILPGINGYEVLEMAKKDPATANIPIVILSNLGQSEDIEKGLKLGAQDFLVKAHLTPQEVVNKLQAILLKK
ncbi:MAG TPA: response regulator [Candidatus Pacearchaeota archaeon]|jgi:CheY-like chemotaxis protein|nr:response regulator [Candidatus Pacearchaeota archaeon]HRR94834.1 response regulator [Candidatus Paceibacterota bacterium]HPC30617.1 response regulator [Candidatus Pacearchaeota archaeon]HQG09361.1 response regulator [Candidatus Pacearchaeota archaeon]HQH20230.1 response regulator [Candidatus Pacearchaeota archaeon]